MMDRARWKARASAHPVRGHFSEARGRGEDGEGPHCPHSGRSLWCETAYYRLLSLKKLRPRCCAQTPALDLVHPTMDSPISFFRSTGFMMPRGSRVRTVLQAGAFIGSLTTATVYSIAHHLR